MTMFTAVWLGIVQGLTEFFPVSSSGHLVLAQKLFGVEGDMLVFDIFVHFGTLLAVFVVFRKQIIELLTGFFGGTSQALSGKKALKDVYSDSQSFKTATAILIGTIPAGIVGIVFKDSIEGLFTSEKAVLYSMLFTGCILFLTFLAGKSEKKIGLISGILIGIAQAVAIAPGVSRSGMTISSALFLGIKREDAGEFSFLLSLPAILGATVLALKDCFEAGAMSFSPEIAIAGILASFISGWLSLVFLMKIVRSGKIGYFGFYCLAVSIAGILFL
jgi:undecaprenyl-diphosphatase